MTGAERGRILHRLAAIMRERPEELVLHRKPRWRQAAGSDPPDGPAGRDRLPGILRRLGRQDHRRSGAGPPQCLDLCAARSGRCGRGHRAVEFRADERGVEDRTGARLRLHGRAQARGTDAACRRCGSAPRRSKPACRRASSISCRATAPRQALRWSRIRASTRFPSRARRRPGRFIMRAAAENITRIGLELGGKSPSVVFADADLDAGGARRPHPALSSMPAKCARRRRASSSIVPSTMRSSRSLRSRAQSLAYGRPARSPVSISAR